MLNHIFCFSVARPISPPGYTAPSQQPPGYEDAIKNSFAVPAGFHGDIRHLRGMETKLEQHFQISKHHIIKS